MPGGFGGGPGLGAAPPLASCRATARLSWHPALLLQLQTLLVMKGTRTPVLREGNGVELSQYDSSNPPLSACSTHPEALKVPCHHRHHRVALEERGRCAQRSSGLAPASLHEIELFNISLCRAGENLLQKEDPEQEQGSRWCLGCASWVPRPAGSWSW